GRAPPTSAHGSRRGQAAVVPAFSAGAATLGGASLVAIDTADSPRRLCADGRRAASSPGDELRSERLVRVLRAFVGEAFSRRPQSRLRARRQPKLRQDLGNVRACRPLGDAELHGNYLVRLAARDQSENVE